MDYFTWLGTWAGPVFAVIGFTIVLLLGITCVVLAAISFVGALFELLDGLIKKALLCLLGAVAALIGSTLFFWLTYILFELTPA